MQHLPVTARNTPLVWNLLLSGMKYEIWLSQATNVEAETSGVHDGDYQLMKHEYSSLGRAKYNGM